MSWLQTRYHGDGVLQQEQPQGQCVFVVMDSPRRWSTEAGTASVSANRHDYKPALVIMLPNKTGTASRSSLRQNGTQEPALRFVLVMLCTNGSFEVSLHFVYRGQI